MAQRKYGLYGYCVILSSQPVNFEKVTMGAYTSKVRTIHYEDIAMVVSTAPYLVPPKRENVFSHQNVINTVTQSFTVIPLSFGNVFRSENDVRILLKKLYENIHQLIPQFVNKIEMGLRIFGKKEWFETEIESDPKLLAMKQSMDTKSVDAAYYDRIRAGEMAQQLYSRLQEKVIEGLNAPLSVLAESTKLIEPIGDRALLNAAYLIDKELEPQFDSKVFELHEQWKEKLEFKYSGPWPVYNFVNIRLTVE